MVKKRNLIVLGLASLTFLTGCGSEKTLVCTTNQSGNGISVDQEITVNFKSKKVDSIKMVVDSKATDDTIKQNWSIFQTEMDKQYKNKESDGVTLKVENDDKKYTYKVSLDVDLNKATKDSLSEYGLSDITSSKENVEDVKKAAEDQGYKCEIK